MLRTLSLLKAAPYVLGVWLISLGGVYLYAHGKGYAKSEATHQAAGIRTFVKAVERAAVVGRAIADIGVQLREELADSRAHESQSTRTVTRIIRENPDYAVVRRPVELQRVRRDQLERIARAAQAD